MPGNPRGKYQQKTNVIQKSLTHRARVRKAYFKMLEKEGEEVPDKKESDAERARRRAGITPGEGDDETEDAEEAREQKDQRNVHKERVALIKNRKKLKRQELYEREKKRRQEIEQKQQQRQKYKKQMAKHNSKGQPKMAPRINRLLDKISQQN